MKPTISISYKSDDPARRDIRARLRQWTRDCAAPWHVSQQEFALTIALKIDDGELIGGTLGDAFLGCLDIHILWVANEHRGQGYGQKLMTVAEQEARQAGCRIMRLDTFDFQAPIFYEKLGFTEFGRFQYFPGGPFKLYFVKQLD